MSLRSSGMHYVPVIATSRNLTPMLRSTLEEIEVFMRRQARKSLLSVLASQGRFDKDITRLSTKLEDAFRVFDVSLWSTTSP